MTVSTKSEAYPSAMREIADTGYNAPESFSVKFPTAKAAVQWRMQFYGYLRALDADADKRGPDKNEQGDLMPNGFEVTAARGRGLLLSVHGKELRFTPRDITDLGSMGDKILESLDKVKTKQENENLGWVKERKQERLKRQQVTAIDMTQTAQTAKVAETETEEDVSVRAVRLSKLAKLDSPEEEPEVGKTL